MSDDEILVRVNFENTLHQPAGSPIGGQFAPKDGGGMESLARGKEARGVSDEEKAADAAYAAGKQKLGIAPPPPEPDLTESFRTRMADMLAKPESFSAEGDEILERANFENPYHEPGGSPIGGQFAHKTGGGAPGVTKALHDMKKKSGKKARKQTAGAIARSKQNEIKVADMIRGGGVEATNTPDHEAVDIVVRLGGARYVGVELKSNFSGKPRVNMESKRRIKKEKWGKDPSSRKFIGKNLGPMKLVTISWDLRGKRTDIFYGAYGVGAFAYGGMHRIVGEAALRRFILKGAR